MSKRTESFEVMKNIPLSVFSYESAGHFLDDVYGHIKLRRPSFSKAAMARRLGISNSGSLAKVLSNRRSLSAKSKTLAAQLMGLNSQEEAYFQLLCEAQTKVDRQSLSLIRETLIERNLREQFPEKRSEELSKVPQSEGFAKEDFRFFIDREYRARSGKNGSYSHRAFARDLGLSPQRLNRVLSHRCGISPDCADKIVENLQLNLFEKKIFLEQVRAKHTRNLVQRRKAAARLEDLLAEGDFQKIEVGKFNLLQDWSILAAYLLVDVMDFKPDVHWAAKRLDLPAKTVSRIYRHLFTAGLLRVRTNGEWVRCAKKQSIQSDHPSHVLRNYYRQMMGKAEKTLDGSDISQRFFSSSVISINHEELEIIRKEIDKFRRGLIARVDKRGGSPERVYGLGIQLFPLDRQEGKQ